MPKTAPLPAFRAFTQPALHRIAMTIAKIFRELPLIPNVEIVTALLPEVFRLAKSINRSIDQSPRNTLFLRLERIG